MTFNAQTEIHEANAKLLEIKLAIKESVDVTELDSLCYMHTYWSKRKEAAQEYLANKERLKCKTA